MEKSGVSHGRLIRRAASQRILTAAILGRAPANIRRHIEAAFRLPLLCLHYPDFSKRRKLLSTIAPPTAKPTPDHWIAYSFARWRVMRFVQSIETRPIIAADLRELIALQMRVIAFRDALFNLNLGLAISMVERMAPQDNDRDDCTSLAMMSLAAAVDRFDVRRGWQFSSYACTAIARLLIRERKRWYREAKFVAAGEAADEPEYRDPELDRIEAVETVNKSLVVLTDREQRVMRMRFGLAKTEKVNLRMIADAIGVTHQRAQQIEATALGKLAGAIAPETAGQQ